MSYMPSARAQVIARRTYARPTNEAGTLFETWSETSERVRQHQQWLWERANGDRALGRAAIEELTAFKQLMLDRKSMVSGRTLWLGGTDISKRRESSQFNCAFLRVVTIHDIVDAFWLLLQGCGVGFEPVMGTLNGFTRKAEIEVIRSQRKGMVTARGRESNRDTLQDGVWHIEVGDSAEAWAKVAGKIMAQKAPFHKLILDFSQIRPAGFRLKGYGWISSGDEMLCKALVAICDIMNRCAGKLLERIDILDIVNWLGTTLSSRRSAEIALIPYGDPKWRPFALAKRNHYELNPQRAQSNNSLMFYSRPNKHDLSDIFDMMVASGGSEPGFINAESALARAPWFKGCNPCGEILLGDKGFCNLCETDLQKFNGDFEGLLKAIHLIARANYRQTCVELHDGILQTTWHELNQFLRLCGVGVTGIVGWEHQNNPAAWQALHNAAQAGCDSMADELGLPRTKAACTIKPSGTLSKVMDCPEGMHRPQGRCIFNNVRFSIHDPIVPTLEDAGYHTFPDPYQGDGVLVRFPVEWSNVKFDTDEQGKQVNRESALMQLERYHMVMKHYVSHNASVTISYTQEELPHIVDWVYGHWDDFVGVSFLPRNDASKTAADLGYPFLPQEVVDEDTFNEYASRLQPLSLDGDLAKRSARRRAIVLPEDGEYSMTVDAGDECAGGVCPVR